jgi:hypothetical protein
MEECPQLPVYNLKVKNTFLRASVVTDSDGDDDLDLDLAFSKRLVTDPPPVTSAILQPKKNSKGIEDSTGAEDTPKVLEFFEPELEPPYAHAGMRRMVTEENWSSWNERQWEPDMEQSCVGLTNPDCTPKRRCWADEVDDPCDIERKLAEKPVEKLEKLAEKIDKPVGKVAIALSPALGVTTDTPPPPMPPIAYQSVHAIAASALLGYNFSQEQETAAQKKQGRRRKHKRESLIDQAARQLKKDEKNKKSQVRTQTVKPLVPMFCHACGGRCEADFKFCRFCGVAAIGEA